MKKILTVILATLMTVSIAKAYTIMPGDTLNRLAKQFNTTVNLLLEINPQVTDPNLIIAGEELTTSFNTELPFFKKLKQITEDMGLLGAFNFVQVQDQYLAGSGITSSVTSITLQTFDYPDGSNVAISDFGSVGYATLEPNTSREENISFTGITQNANGTATLTGVTRGLGLKYPYTTVTANKFAHAGGTILRISNSAPFYNELVAKQNASTLTGDITISTSTVPLVRLYFGENQGAYIWYNTTTDQFGWASSTTEFQFNTEGTTFSVVQPITLTTGELRLATSSIDFSFTDANLLRISTTTAQRMDLFWNDKWLATSTIPNLVISHDATTTGHLLTGNTVPTNEMSAGDLFVGGNSTTTGSLSFGELCPDGANCTDTINKTEIIPCIATSTPTVITGGVRVLPHADDNGAWAGAGFTDNSTSQCYSSFFYPTSTPLLGLGFIWSSGNAGTCNMYASIQTDGVKIGEVVDSNLDGNGLTTYAQTAQNSLNIAEATSTQFDALTYGDYVSVRLRRDATNASDTCSASAIITGMRLLWGN